MGGGSGSGAFQDLEMRVLFLSSRFGDSRLLMFGIGGEGFRLGFRGSKIWQCGFKFFIWEGGGRWGGGAVIAVGVWACTGALYNAAIQGRTAIQGCGGENAWGRWGARSVRAVGMELEEGGRGGSGSVQVLVRFWFRGSKIWRCGFSF